MQQRLLHEAIEREIHADALVQLAVSAPARVHGPTLRMVARSQRVRALELRGQAAALLAVPFNPRA